jgi:hypothetical protein
MHRGKYARDANEPEIIGAFQDLGCSVWPLCEKEPADLLVLIPGAIHHRLRLIEVKDPAKPPSARELTPTQKNTHAIWPVHVVFCQNDALQIVRDARGRITLPSKGYLSFE